MRFEDMALCAMACSFKTLSFCGDCRVNSSCKPCDRPMSERYHVIHMGICTRCSRIGSSVLIGLSIGCTPTSMGLASCARRYSAVFYVSMSQSLCVLPQETRPLRVACISRLQPLPALPFLPLSPPRSRCSDSPCAFLVPCVLKLQFRQPMQERAAAFPGAGYSQRTS